MKNYLFIILLAFLTINSFSQIWQFSASEGYPSSQTRLNIITSDLFGNTFIGGSSGNGIFIIKYDSSGNKLWEKNYHYGSGNVTSLCTDNEGNLYTDMYAWEVEGVNYHPDSGTLFTKFDPNGNMLWIRQIKMRILLSERTDAQNNLIATGNFAETVNLGNGYTLTVPSGQSKLFMAKFNTAGECMWAMQDDGGRYPLVVNQKGEMFAKAELYGQMTSVGQGSQQVILDPANGFSYCAKYNSTGTLMWVKQFSTADYTGDEFGNTYTFQPDVSDLANGSNKNIYLIKYDPNGNQLWKRTHVYLDNGYRFAMKANNQGDLYITGGFSNYMTIDDTSIYDGGNTRVFVAKIDSSGTLKWVTTTSGAGGAGAKDLTVANGNEIYITGDIGGGESVFGSHSISQANGVFAAKLIDNEITSIHIKDNSQIVFDVFPNPTGGIFNVVCKGDETVKHFSLTISNAAGQLIYSIKDSMLGTEFHKTIDLSSQSKGIYFIEVIADEKRNVKKIVLN